MKYSSDELASIRVRHALDGVQVTCKSTPIEAYFIKNSHLMKSEFVESWGGCMPYNMPRGLNGEGNYQYMIEQWGGKNLMANRNRPNMAFLRAEGLKDEITVLFKMPCSETYLKRYKNYLENSIIGFYHNIIVPSLNMKAGSFIIPSHLNSFPNFVDFMGFGSWRALGRIRKEDLINRYRTELEKLGISQVRIIRRVRHYA